MQAPIEQREYPNSPFAIVAAVVVDE